MEERTKMKTTTILSMCILLLSGCVTQQSQSRNSPQQSREAEPLAKYLIGTWHREADKPEESTVTFHSDGTWEGFTTDSYPFVGGKPKKNIMKGVYRVEGNKTFERATYTSSGETLPLDEIGFTIDVISPDKHISTASDGSTSSIYIRLTK
jgi:hypothetical protein